MEVQFTIFCLMCISLVKLVKFSFSFVLICYWFQIPVNKKRLSLATGF